MKERPILMSAPMVRACLREVDPKTKTRRVMKPQPHLSPSAYPDKPPHLMWQYSKHYATSGQEAWLQHCPYGVPGDRLWVKETWQAQEAFDHLSPTAIGEVFAGEHGEPWCPIRYVADGKCEGSVDQWQESPVGKTRVSIHMPRWASRIMLTVTEVRVERLQDISEADAKAEGWPGPDMRVSADPEVHRDAARDWYMDLWGDINGPASWAANPWVWAISFERAP